MAGRILIVDDEKDMLVLLKRILVEDTKHEVVTESNPQRALDLFRERPFELVVTDLKMPKMDGIQMLEEFRRTSPDVSVVILTAYATIETAVEAIQKGAHDYITKPFRRERILLTVNKAMEWQEMLRENKVLREGPGRKGGQSVSGGLHTGDAGVDGADQAGRSLHGHRADHRGERHRKGAGGQGPAPAQPAEHPEACHRELHGPARAGHRERAFRAPEGGLHRGLERQEGTGGRGP